MLQMNDDHDASASYDDDDDYASVDVHEPTEEDDDDDGDGDGEDDDGGDEVLELTDVDDTLNYSKGTMRENDVLTVLARSVHNDKNHRVSSPMMTKYEYTKLRGFRLQQLASGCPPFVIVPDTVCEMSEIFDLEFAQRRIPYIIKRQVSNTEFEYWKVRDLTISNPPQIVRT